jgi:hypothetical protein
LLRPRTGPHGEDISRAQPRANEAGERQTIGISGQKLGDFAVRRLAAERGDQEEPGISPGRVEPGTFHGLMFYPAPLALASDLPKSGPTLLGLGRWRATHVFYSRDRA